MAAFGRPGEQVDGIIVVELVDLQPATLCRQAPPETKKLFIGKHPRQHDEHAARQEKPEWRTELRLAIQEAATANARSCGDVLNRLQAGKPEAREAARAIEIHANTGGIPLPAESASDE